MKQQHSVLLVLCLIQSATLQLELHRKFDPAEVNYDEIVQNVIKNTLQEEQQNLDTMEASAGCISSIIVDAQTGPYSNKYYGADQNPWYGANPQLAIELSNSNVKYSAELTGKKDYGEKVVRVLTKYDFNPHLPGCFTKDQIKNVYLQAPPGGTDGWFVTSVDTYTRNAEGRKTNLTSNPNLYRWIDYDEQEKYLPNSARLVPLTLAQPTDLLKCGYGIPICECHPSAKVCVFNLEVDEIMTFTSYKKYPVSAGDGLFIRGGAGVIYQINKNGNTEPLEQYQSKFCANISNAADCTDPQFVDGKTYRMAIGVNGQIPGPTVIAHENQILEIRVHNNLSTEGISIHWHGMHQKGTPWMDGVGQVTQCQIGPSSSYVYMYTASPSGTFWYHSHSGAQRTDGFFGTLIVKERPEKIERIKKKIKLGDFEDHPGKHSITLMDWQLEASLDLFTQLNPGLGFYPGHSIGEVPPNDKTKRYNSTFSFEDGEVGPVPYFSGLINGKGRHSDVPYPESRLSVFPVQSGKRYRFRLIGAQGLYAYKFSIDGHKLTVVGTDGFWTKPLTPADYIIIHTGERYDFILEAKAKARSGEKFWMRAETLEINKLSNRGVPPYESLGHIAEAILQYTDGSIEEAPVIKSSEYNGIEYRSPNCIRDGCIAINCPFKNFHKSYNIECINVNQLELLEASENVPESNPSDSCPNCRHFINFNFEGDSTTSAVNGRNFILPPVPPQTQNADFQVQAKKCDLSIDCNPPTLGCSCTGIIEIPFNKTVQFVLTAVGRYNNAHPIHLHGHTFRVAHIGYPTYDPETGFISRHSSDIHCDDESGCTHKDCDPKRCTKPSWSGGKPPSFTVNKWTVQKDTIIIPAGGYAVINIVSDNPGHWFLHCHIEVHQLEGMALIINEAPEQQRSLNAPVELNKCGDISFTVAQYEASLAKINFGVAE